MSLIIEANVFELLTLTCEIDKFGDTYYRNKEGVLHRIHGPAIICNTTGTKFWFKDGKLHREDGPALDWAVCKEYWVNGFKYTEEDFKQWQKDNGIKPTKQPTKRRSCY